MKKSIAVLCVFLLLAFFPLTAIAGDADRSFVFSLTAEGKSEISVQPGDVITVRFDLRSEDGDSYPIYAMQNEIRYDASAFELVEGGGLAAAGVAVTDLDVGEGCREYYMNFVSMSGRDVWKANTLVGSFQLRVLAQSGSYELSCRDYEMSSSDGRAHFPAICENVRVTVGKGGAEKEERSLFLWLLAVVLLIVIILLLLLLTARVVTCYPNNGGKAKKIRVRKGKMLKPPVPPVNPGFLFTGWYMEPACLSLWDFAGSAVENSMDLYAGWKKIL